MAKELGITIKKAKEFFAKSNVEEIDTKNPIMEIEINIDEKIAEKCLIYSDESYISLARKIATKYNLSKQEEQLILEQLKQHF